MDMSLHERNLVARLRDANIPLTAADRNGLLTLIERLEQAVSARVRACLDKDSKGSNTLISAGLECAAPAAQAVELSEGNAANLITIDRRDLYVFVRGAIKRALEDASDVAASIGERMSAADCWSEAHTRTMVVFDNLQIDDVPVPSEVPSTDGGRIAARAVGAGGAAQGDSREWTGNPDADTAILLLDRLDVQPYDDIRVEQLEGIVRKLARAAVSPARAVPACRACDAGVCSAHGPEQSMARKRVAAAPADAREPVATFDDGLKVYLDSWTGGRHEAGSFGEITLRFTDDRSTTIRDYRAKDIVPADPGDAAAFTNMWFTAIFRNVTRDEAQELVEHPKWSAGCWGHAFKQRDKALSERDAARAMFKPVVTLNDVVAISATLDIPLPTDTIEQTVELVNMCVARACGAQGGKGGAL